MPGGVAVLMTTSSCGGRTLTSLRFAGGGSGDPRRSRPGHLAQVPAGLSVLRERGASGCIPGQAGVQPVQIGHAHIPGHNGDAGRQWPVAALAPSTQLSPRSGTSPSPGRRDRPPRRTACPRSATDRRPGTPCTSSNRITLAGWYWAPTLGIRGCHRSGIGRHPRAAANKDGSGTPTAFASRLQNAWSAIRTSPSFNGKT